MGLMLSSLHFYRVERNVPDVAWSTTLEAQAKVRALQLSSSKYCTANSSNTGENIFLKAQLNASEPYPCFWVAAAWKAQENNYIYTNTPWTDNADHYDDIKYFTQMIWAGSRQFACATAASPMGPGSPAGYQASCVAVVCLYSEPGNTPKTDTAFWNNVKPPPAMELPPPNDDACDDMFSLLAFHNEERSLRGAPLLEWNTTLASLARTRARNLSSLSTCSADGLASAVGENVFLARAKACPGCPTVPCASALNPWKDQELQYLYGMLPYTANKDHLASVKFFAQMAWANASEIGCASVSMPTDNGTAACVSVVCMYNAAPGMARTMTDDAWYWNVRPYQSARHPNDWGNPNLSDKTGYDNVVRGGGCTDPVNALDRINFIRQTAQDIQYPVLTWNQTLADAAQVISMQYANISNCSMAGPPPNGWSVLLQREAQQKPFSSPPCSTAPYTWDFFWSQGYNSFNTPVTDSLGAQMQGYEQMYEKASLKQLGCAGSSRMSKDGHLDWRCLAIVCVYGEMPLKLSLN